MRKTFAVGKLTVESTRILLLDDAARTPTPLHAPLDASGTGLPVQSGLAHPNTVH